MTVQNGPSVLVYEAPAPPEKWRSGATRVERRLLVDCLLVVIGTILLVWSRASEMEDRGWVGMGIVIAGLGLFVADASYAIYHLRIARQAERRFRWRDAQAELGTTDEPRVGAEPAAAAVRRRAFVPAPNAKPGR